MYTYDDHDDYIDYGDYDDQPTSRLRSEEPFFNIEFFEESLTEYAQFIKPWIKKIEDKTLKNKANHCLFIILNTDLSDTSTISNALLLSANDCFNCVIDDIYKEILQAVNHVEEVADIFEDHLCPDELDKLYKDQRVFDLYDDILGTFGQYQALYEACLSELDAIIYDNMYG